MGMLANAFTWWNGASWGTSLFTRRHGEEAGRDAAGNIYFQHRKQPSRRWVIYAGSNDASVVPPGWNAWLRGTIDAVPDQAIPARRAYEIDPSVNPTGTAAAHRLGGGIEAGGQRAPATGDYQAWKPE